jgi:hypothetical protein
MTYRSLHVGLSIAYERAVDPNLLEDRSPMNIKRLVGIAAAVVLLGVSPTFAAVVIDFGTGTAPDGGSFTLLAGGNASGTAIPVDLLKVSGAPTNNGSWDLSGTAVSNDANGSASLDFNTLTNTIKITGGIPGLGIANGTVLLSGSFSSFTADANGLSNAKGPDTKSALLLSALGLATDFKFNFFGFSLTAQEISPGVFDVTSTDIRNTGVPEPTSIVLFGTVLFSCCWIIRRRRLSAAQ